MNLSAASSAALILGLSSVGWAQEATGVSERLARGLAYVQSHGRTVGVGVVVDRSGNVLVHRSVAAQPMLSGILPDGRTYMVAIVGADDVSQLAVLRFIDAPRDLHPIELARAQTSGPLRLTGVATWGEFSAQLTASDKYGIFEPTRRLLPLSEVTFSQPEQSVATSPLFTPDGRLVGFVAASLQSRDAMPAEATALRQPVQALAGANVVAYTVGPEVMDRAVRGLLSNTRRVDYPTLGLMCATAATGGAQVASVADGSPAWRAGIRVGDVITKIGSTAIRNQYDYGRAVFEARIGETVLVSVRRGGETFALPVTVGR